MYVLLSLVAGVFALWAVGVGACILLGWRRKSLISTVKRLAKWHAGILAVLGLLLLDLRPCVTTPLMSTAEKAEFKQGLDRESDASRHRISVTGEELSSGLRSAADLLQMELHSEVVFPESDRFQLRFALGHPLGYLNGSLDGSARIDDGKLETSWDRLWVGRIPFLGFTRTLSQRLFSYVLDREPISRKALASISAGRIQDRRAQFEIVRDQNVIGAVASGLQSREMSEDGALAVSIVESWMEPERWSTTEAQGGDMFVEGTRFMFREAQRLAPSRSSLRQNRAAILAAAIWMGHSKFLRITGQTMAVEVHDRMVRTGGRVGVHGRNDLVRHFWVSAAITAFASARISNLVGISKEEMDSGEGGSGFSFADLLADRAGVRFAQLALGTPQQATAMQARVSREWIASDAIAPIDGLPEGIRQADFLSEYGGVDGPVYRQWSDKIDQRIRSSKLLDEALTLGGRR